MENARNKKNKAHLVDVLIKNALEYGKHQKLEGIDNNDLANQEKEQLLLNYFVAEIKKTDNE
jgi:hypothetical protein